MPRRKRYALILSLSSLRSTSPLSLSMVDPRLRAQGGISRSRRRLEEVDPVAVLLGEDSHGDMVDLVEDSLDERRRALQIQRLGMGSVGCEDPAACTADPGH